MNNYRDYHFKFDVKKEVLAIIEAAATAQYPSLSTAEATEQLFGYILNSIIMDFHPEDLFVPAINNSTEVEFKAIKAFIPHKIAARFARHFVSTNKKSYSNLTHEIRRRLYKKHQEACKKQNEQAIVSRTFRNYLDKLAKLGLIESEGDGRWRTYSLADGVNIPSGTSS